MVLTRTVTISALLTEFGTRLAITLYEKVGKLPGLAVADVIFSEAVVASLLIAPFNLKTSLRVI